MTKTITYKPEYFKSMVDRCYTKCETLQLPMKGEFGNDKENYINFLYNKYKESDSEDVTMTPGQVKQFYEDCILGLVDINLHPELYNLMRPVIDQVGQTLFDTEYETKDASLEDSVRISQNNIENLKENISEYVKEIGVDVDPSILLAQ